MEKSLIDREFAKMVRQVQREMSNTFKCDCGCVFSQHRFVKSKVMGCVTCEIYCCPDGEFTVVSF